MNANPTPTSASHASGKLHRQRKLRRAFAYQSILTTVVCVILFSAAVAYLDPSLVPAAVRPKPKAAPVQNHAAHEEFTVMLSQLLMDCQEVLAIQQNVSTASVDAILWLHDLNHPGVIDNDEVAILSHDRLSRLLTLYSMGEANVATMASEPKSAPAPIQPKAEAAGPSKSKVLTPRAPMVAASATKVRYYGDTVSRSALEDPLFKARWRTQPGVKAQIVAEGLSDLRLETVEDGQIELSHLRLWLRWAADSADGADERTAIIDRSARPTAPQE